MGGQQRSKREIGVYAFMLNTFSAQATEQKLNKLHYKVPVKIIINIYGHQVVLLKRR